MDFKNIESKWQKYWKENETFKTDVWDFSKPKYYVLDMFPYPSGVGLHAGHVEGYTATDIMSRMKRMQGYNVLHPMGYDSFGLPAEQYAVQTGNHPNGFTEKNIKYFSEQLNSLGFDYDWSKQVSTSDPKFYKWTQWIFSELYKDGYAKYVDMPVNWCEELGTVLSNDEVIDGKSERGGYPVVRKNMKQLCIDQAAFAEKLLEGLDELDWPESTKEMQRNWIGKSIGAQVKFKVANTEYDFTVFTTRCDTLFGATYCVLSPEHDLVDKITTSEYKNVVDEYKKICASKSDLERTELNKEKTGVFTGAYAVNPVNNKKVPIWIADYVLASYGTGAIMAVPAHDERDFEFAKKYNLEIIPVLENSNQIDVEMNEAYTGDGLHINSEFLNGLNKEESINKMLEFLEEHNIGSKKVNYRFREWIFARQRYWGEPVPIVHLENGEDYLLPESELPLILPELEDYKSKDGKAPLENAEEWKKYTTEDGIKGVRETSTMPGSAGSSWYFLRYIDPDNDKELCNKELAKYWMPVDLYMGGPEHAVGHLIYSRIWNNYLYDLGISPVKEPFKKLVHQGMILGENGIKMGKRYPEFAIDPKDIANEYGADTLRLYEMFMGPIEASKPWSATGVEGARKFIDRVWRFFTNMDNLVDDEGALDKAYHTMVKKVTNDFENLGFNTAISQFMIFVNECYKVGKCRKSYAEGFIKMLSCITPHMGEEIWEMYGHNDTIAYESWPTYDEAKLIDEEVTLAVSVNGKLRSTINVSLNEDEQVVKELALSDEKILKHLENKEVVKVIVVPNKIVNIVAK